MKLSILTLFPQFFESAFQSSILKRAISGQQVTVELVNIRDFATDKHKVTDDRPYGGGPGMVMKVEPIYAALQHTLKVDPVQHVQQNATQSSWQTKVVLTSAKGKLFHQASAGQYAELEHLVIICGHYEGVDERVAQYLIDEEVRIGDYVLTGGEPAALVMADAVTRLLPGVLGNEESTSGESHSTPGFLAHPQYTRPVEFQGWKVPDILLTGHHAQITDWRHQQTSPDVAHPESAAEVEGEDHEASQ